MTQLKCHLSLCVRPIQGWHHLAAHFLFAPLVPHLGFLAILSWFSFGYYETGKLRWSVLSLRSNACCFLSFCPRNHRSFQVDASNSVQWSKKCLSRDDGLRFEPFLRAAARSMVGKEERGGRGQCRCECRAPRRIVQLGKI